MELGSTLAQIDNEKSALTEIFAVLPWKHDAPLGELIFSERFRASLINEGLSVVQGDCIIVMRTKTKISLQHLKGFWTTRNDFSRAIRERNVFGAESFDIPGRDSDDRRGGVMVDLAGEVILLNPGEEICWGRDADVGKRNTHSLLAGGCRYELSEFSVINLFTQSYLMRELLLSKSPEAHAVLYKIKKTAACLSIVYAQKSQFQYR